VQNKLKINYNSSSSFRRAKRFLFVFENYSSVKEKRMGILSSKEFLVGTEKWLIRHRREQFVRVARLSPSFLRAHSWVQLLWPCVYINSPASLPAPVLLSTSFP
jgi:hypothetical protein